MRENRSAENCGGGFRGRRRAGDGRDAIAATRACQMSAVAEDGFAGAERDFFFGPVDAISDAIRDVNLAISGQANQRSVLNAEIGIVMGDDGVAG